MRCRRRCECGSARRGPAGAAWRGTADPKRRKSCAEGTRPMSLRCGATGRARSSQCARNVRVHVCVVQTDGSPIPRHPVAGVDTSSLVMLSTVATDGTAPITTADAAVATGTHAAVVRSGSERRSAIAMWLEKGDGVAFTVDLGLDTRRRRRPVFFFNMKLLTCCVGSSAVQCQPREVTCRPRSLSSRPWWIRRRCCSTQRAARRWRARGCTQTPP